MIRGMAGRCRREEGEVEKRGTGRRELTSGGGVELQRSVGRGSSGLSDGRRRRTGGDSTRGEEGECKEEEDGRGAGRDGATESGEECRG